MLPPEESLDQDKGSSNNKQGTYGGHHGKSELHVGSQDSVQTINKLMQQVKKSKVNRLHKKLPP